MSTALIVGGLIALVLGLYWALMWADPLRGDDDDKPDRIEW